MRPELGSEDMEEVVWDPTDLFLDVGMLVTEARIPDTSPKGRVEGPHVPPMSGAYPHTCDKHREQCRKADHLRKQMLLLCRNGIPMRIDIILLPNCDHGQQEASALEGTYLPSTDDIMLLERWDVQIQQKRCEKIEPSFVNGRVLLQAIRSYLHFSQLSSWLISNRGYLPLQIVYRVYAPGENVNQSFSSLPDIHLFPVADLRTSLVRVGVSSIPRQQTIPHLKCKEESKFFNKIPVRKKISPEKDVLTMSPPKVESLLKEPKTWSKKTEELRRTSPELFEEIHVEDKKTQESLGAIPKKHRSHSQTTDTKPIDCHLLQHKPPIYKPSQKKADDLTATHPGISHHPKHIPHTKSKYHKMSTQNTIPNKPMPLSHLISEFKPLDLRSPIDPQYLNMRLPSPKVLFTQSAGSNQSYCKKKELDFDSPPLEQKVEDRLMSEKISDLVKPLNSEELEAYLSSLSHPLKEKPTARAELGNIPITKCKFYIGDGDKSHINTSNDNSLQNIKCNLFPDDFHKQEKQLTHDNVPNAPDIGSTSDCRGKSPTLPATLPPRHTFKKSLSEPGLHMDKLSVYQIELSTSPDERLCDLDSTLAKSFQDLPFFDKENSENGCSSDSSSTPTNSLSERNGAMSKYLSHTSYKLHNTGVSRESTPTSELISNKRKNGLQDQGCDHNPSKTNIPSLSEHHENIKNAQKNGSDAFLHDDLRKEDSGSRTDGKGSSLCKQLLQKELKKNIDDPTSHKDSVPDCDKIKNFHKSLSESSAMMFHTTTGLPSRSSPAPIKRKSSKRFDYDDTLMNTRAIKNALSCSKLTLQSECRSTETNPEDEKVLSASAPASTCLLGNFEESVLNGRIEPVGVVEGFTCEIGAGGSFCPKHLNLPVTAYFFQLSDDNAPSPYLGHINLESLGKKGYHIPKCGTVQVTLFNPNKTVVKMFVVMYDLSDMPANCQTFLRQRTVYMPVDPQSCQPSYLRYLIHLRFATTRSGKLYLHTDIRLIFARDKFEFDPNIAKYELRSFTEGPQNPKFSPKR